MGACHELMDSRLPGQVLERRRAIEFAFGRAKPGDSVLLAGKGTEPSIVLGTRHVPWDERAVAQELLGGDASV